MAFQRFQATHMRSRQDASASNRSFEEKILGATAVNRQGGGVADLQMELFEAPKQRRVGVEVLRPLRARGADDLFRHLSSLGHCTATLHVLLQYTVFYHIPSCLHHVYHARSMSEK